MTTAEYKEKLIEDYNKTTIALEQLRGAIAACEALLKAETQEETTED
jgi:hypothetical protein